MKHSVHWRTPALVAHDPRGLPLRNVAYLRFVADADAEGQITRQQYDAAGRLVLQRDPRLMDGVSPPNLHTVYDLSARPVRVDSVDAGWRLILPGLAGEERQRWDARGHHREFRHDALLRLLAVTENAQVEVERYTYTDHTGDAGHNRRGELSSLWDLSGTLALDSYGLSGEVLRETREFVGAPETFTTLRQYSPLGALLQLTDAGGHRQVSRYDIAGQLLQLSLGLAGAIAAEPVTGENRYNAAGQIVEQLARNGVRSVHTYDPSDGRLLRLLARKGLSAPLQDLHYIYDPGGNLLRIEDHVLATVYFANQRVDGNRHFVYDSLYRLIESHGFEGDIPQQLPGLPQPVQPIDPGRRFNYSEYYRYDEGNNLIELQHVREGHNFTQQTVIDPHSNRGIRWKNGDPAPVFAEHFDPHGNQLKLQPGTLPLAWDNQDQLTRVTLLQHGNGLPDDEEIYRYSQDERVYKCWLSHTPTTTHRREVRYLPGLEIHARSDGQLLHVIVLPGGRCLHWLSGRPPGIENDQLRYSLDDHLGSCALELDQHADIISLEHYYPFGGTAWWGVRSALEASYKTIRYSGQELDVSGLYYYGARYYAPWLQRWISADPAGDVDGLNLYAFVGNDPLGFGDVTGMQKTHAQQLGEIKAFMKNLKSAAKEVDKQNTRLEHIFEERDLNKTIAKTTAFSIFSGVLTVGASVAGGVAGGLLGTATMPVLGTITGAGVGASVAKLVVGKTMTALGKKLEFEPHITPKAKPLALTEIKKKNGSALSRQRAQDTYEQYSPSTAEGQRNLIKKLAKTQLKDLATYGVKEFMEVGKLAEEANDALDVLSPMKIKKLQTSYITLQRDLQTDYNEVMDNFVALGNPFAYVNGEKIELSAVKKEMMIVNSKLQKALETTSRYSRRLTRSVND